jgi:predicted esterase
LNTPIFLGHGRDDFIVPYTYGQLTEQAVKAFNPKGFLIIKELHHYIFELAVALHSYSCQHGSVPQEHQDILEFIKTHIPPEDRKVCFLSWRRSSDSYFNNFSNSRTGKLW